MVVKLPSKTSFFTQENIQFPSLNAEALRALIDFAYTGMSKYIVTCQAWWSSFESMLLPSSPYFKALISSTASCQALGYLERLEAPLGLGGCVPWWGGFSGDPTHLPCDYIVACQEGGVSSKLPVRRAAMRGGPKMP